MALPLIGAVAGLLSTLMDGVTGHMKRKQKLKQTLMENRMRLARSDREFNHEWEMKQLENVGWKDDVLFLPGSGFLSGPGLILTARGKSSNPGRTCPTGFCR